MATGTLQPRIPVVNNVVSDEQLDGPRNVGLGKPVSVAKVHRLLTDKHSSGLTDRHLRAVHRLTQYFRDGFFMKDAALVCEVLLVCTEKLQADPQYEVPVCQLVEVCGRPFVKERTSDEDSYAEALANLLSELGHIMTKVSSTSVRLQVAKSLMNFYTKGTSVSGQIEGFQGTSLACNRESLDRSTVARSLVESLQIVEDFNVQLTIINVLEQLSSSALNCDDILAMSGASLLCASLRVPDPTGRMIFTCVETLWNLLEHGSAPLVAEQLSCTECISALKEAFVRQIKEGHSHADRQLRNDLLIVTMLVATLCPSAPLVETGFTKLAVLLATHPEVKSHSGLLRGVKLYQNHEDFEFKKLLMSSLVVVSKESASHQILSRAHVLLALFAYVRPNDSTVSMDWSPAQFEELQLQALESLATIAPLCVEDYMTCQGNTRLLMLLDWCIGEADYGGHGNSFYGGGGRGNKRAQMRYCLRLLRSICSIGDDNVNQDLVDQGAIHQIVGILLNASTSSDDNDAIDVEMQCDMLFIVSTLCEGDAHRKELFGSEGVQVVVEYLSKDPQQINSPLGHHKLLLASVDCVWSGVLGCYINEQRFLESEGVFRLLDLLEMSPSTMQNVVLGCLVDLCESGKALTHVSNWRGNKSTTVGKLLVELWRKEEIGMGVARDKHGTITDVSRPLIGSIQERQGVIPLPADRPSQAVVDVSENMRAKIYSMFCRLGFNAVPGLSTADYVTVSVIEKYLDFKMAEVWREIKIELEQEDIRPVSPDAECLNEITKIFEDQAAGVLSTQNQLFQSQRNQQLIEEEEYFEKIKESHRQEEKAFTDFMEFVTRTSDYDALKASKQRQLSVIEASRLGGPAGSGMELKHETLEENLQTTTFCGRRVAVESTPLELTRTLIDHTAGAENDKKHLLVTAMHSTGSLFNEFPRTSMGNILSTIYLWSMHELRATAARMLEMTKMPGIGNVYALLRHYCGEDQRDRPIRDLRAAVLRAADLRAADLRATDITGADSRVGDLRASNAIQQPQFCLFTDLFVLVGYHLIAY